MSIAVTTRYRLGVAGRVVAAVLGSYAVAALAAILLAMVLPMPPIDRAVTATLTAITLLPFVAIACFWVRSAARAWLLVAALALPLATVAALGGWRP